ncbi:uncharacterized protein LOC116116374 [Pistacia vera]|uniref:uncharacterized protein LOC116116374 n=1 Tax=Pistacia vera TaxID=55513 RepID=UPI001263D084|nr:uncharacterized protein LOC116116374 [Pistacia vera]
MPHVIALLSCNMVSFAAQRPQRSKAKKMKQVRTKEKQSSRNAGFGIEKKEPLWRCVEGCGACCKLDKGPAFPTPEEIFDNPEDVKLYRSLIGPDGWCINYEKNTRKCSVYPERPYFCRVEAGVFESLYGIGKKKFNQAACSCCRDTIKEVYGTHSEELANFNRSIRSCDA